MLRDEFDQAILALLAAGESRSGLIAEALDRPARTVKDRLGRLRDTGLVRPPSGGDWRLTGAGKRAALAATVPEPTASIALLNDLPLEHQAMLRLIVDAVVARRALEEVHPANWPGFVLLGPTKSGKTLIGQLAARRFGLNPDAATLELEVATESSLLGRLEQDPGRVWRRTASPLAWPLVILDEYGKAPRELRSAIFAYLAGKSRYSLGEETIEVHPTAVVTLNPDDGDLARLLPDSYLRRSVVLDTTPLRAVTRDLDEVAVALTRVVLPQVSLDLLPPEPALPDYARESLRALLQGCLTDRGWDLVDVEAVSRLALGRWATLPADLPAPVLKVAADYLLVTDTRGGLVVDDWPLVFEHAVDPALGALTAGVLAAARARHVAHEEQQATTVRASVGASLALSGERQRLLEALDYAVSSAPRGGDLTPSERATKATARGKASRLRVLISEARSLAALADLDGPLNGEVLAPLAALASAVEARRSAAVEARVQQRQREADTRRQAVVQAKAARQGALAAHRAAKARHAALQALCRRTTTRPDEAVLDALLGAGCLTQQSEPYEEETFGSRLSRLGRALGGPAASSPPPAPPAANRWPLGMAPLSPSMTLAQPTTPGFSQPERSFVTKTRTWYEDRSGHQYQARELVAWGSRAVDAVLQAAPAAEGLPPFTRPAPRRASPRRA